MSNLCCTSLSHHHVAGRARCWSEEVVLRRLLSPRALSLFRHRCSTPSPVKRMVSDDAPPPYTPTPSASPTLLRPNPSSTAQPTCPPPSSPLRDPSLNLQTYIPSLKRYLLLLSHFRDLQAKVESYEGDNERLGTLSPAEKWKLCLHLAVERLQRWINIFGGREQLPWHTMPPDVALVFFVWMTSSSGLFAEDVWRMHETLLQEGAGEAEWLRRRRPKLKDIWKMVSRPTTRKRASADSRRTLKLDSFGQAGAFQLEGQHEWEKGTHCTFDPLLAMEEVQALEQVCPRCQTSVAVGEFSASRRWRKLILVLFRATNLQPHRLGTRLRPRLPQLQPHPHSRSARRWSPPSKPFFAVSRHVWTFWSHRSRSTRSSLLSRVRSFSSPLPM